MSELFDFGRYAPFIAAAYLASFAGLGALIYIRVKALRDAARREEAENRNQANKETE